MKATIGQFFARVRFRALAQRPEKGEEAQNRSWLAFWRWPSTARNYILSDVPTHRSLLRR